MSKKPSVDLTGMDRAFFEALDATARVELLCRLHALAIEQAERLAQTSTNSSRPPSSDGPFGPLRPGSGPAGRPPSPSLPLAVPAAPKPSPSGRRPGKQRGAKGVWRSEALVAQGERHHYPAACAICGTSFELWDRP